MSNKKSSAVLSKRRSADSSAAAFGLSISKSARRAWAMHGFLRIKRVILGDTYQLSLVLIGDARARALARTYKHKDTPSNVLSFPLDDGAGEIYINLAQVRREATRFGLSPAGHALFLFIHGCLHLAGHHHGGTMEQAEDAFVRRFNIR